eukprot:TRINITY_DN4989_c0_g1_i2.p1 TRINITY_DN4989_c0_g1~~TRINITY_DN4989_c0_g1_i2.p1  ORF type:complete len:131 (+),score=25.58 TRINITY_DN4989_c0_g1_i2:248-640(+)
MRNCEPCRYRQLVLELVRMLTSQAMEICERTKKKTITEVEILQALEQLDLKHYLAEAQAAAEDFKAQSTTHRAKQRQQRLSSSTVDIEELERQQAALFEQARSRMQTTQPAEEPAAAQEGFQLGDTSMFD